MRYLLLAGIIFCSVSYTAEVILDPEPVTGPTQPNFQATVGSVMSLQAEIPDVKKLRAKAAALLKAQKLSVAEIAEKLDVDGKPDLQRCIDYIVIDALGKITQAKITGISIAAQHPVSVQAP